jgi:hypothetical protein
MYNKWKGNVKEKCGFFARPWASPAEFGLKIIRLDQTQRAPRKSLTLFKKQSYRLLVILLMTSNIFLLIHPSRPLRLGGSKIFFHSPFPLDSMQDSLTGDGDGAIVISGGKGAPS